MTAQPQTLPEVVRAAATRFGSRDAVADGDVRMSFEHLHEEVRRTAKGYLALGLEPRQRVALWA
ncbi:MAG: fatty acid--CoA ligase family protein, partial [Actinomycetes bacterium]